MIRTLFIMIMFFFHLFEYTVCKKKYVFVLDQKLFFASKKPWSSLKTFIFQRGTKIGQIPGQY